MNTMMIQKALEKAMTKAGVAAQVTVRAETDQTDSYADYTGYAIECEDEAVKARAAAWVGAFVAQHIPGGGRVTSFRVCRANMGKLEEREVTFVQDGRRFSLGD